MDRAIGLAGKGLHPWTERRPGTMGKTHPRALKQWPFWPTGYSRMMDACTHR